MIKQKRPGAYQDSHLTPSKYLDLLDDIRFLEGDWRDRAACVFACRHYSRDYDPMDWFPQSSTEVPHHVKDVCDGCEVRIECLVYALSTGQSSGVWAGRSEKELKTVRIRLRKALREYV